MRQYAITKLGCPARRWIAEHGGLHAAANDPRSIRCSLNDLNSPIDSNCAKVETPSVPLFILAGPCLATGDE